MADGGLPEAHDWSDPMAKRAPKSDLEAKGPILKVVGGTPTPKPMSISLDSDVETHIGGRLRAMYDSVLREPVPDRFLDLLRQLDSKMGGTPDDGLPQTEAKPKER
jgi:hypothetical protein